MKRFICFILMVALFTPVSSWALTEDVQNIQSRLSTDEGLGSYAQKKANDKVFGQRVTILGKIHKLNGIYMLSKYQQLIMPNGVTDTVLVEYKLDGNMTYLEKYINKTVMLTGFLTIPNGYRYLTSFYYFEPSNVAKEMTQVLYGTVRRADGEETYYYLDMQSGEKLFLADNPKNLRSLVGNYVRVSGNYRFGSAPSVFGGERVFEVSNSSVVNANISGQGVDNSTINYIDIGNYTNVSITPTPRVMPGGITIVEEDFSNNTGTTVNTNVNANESALRRILKILSNIFRTLASYMI